MILLRECSHLNKMLLKGMLGRGGCDVHAAARRQTQNDMVNHRL